MHISQRKEQFSTAYVRAVAAVAGMNVSKPSVDLGIDLELSAPNSQGRPGYPKLDLQLKSTSDNIRKDDQITYRLKRKNYDDLRSLDVLVPRLLVLVLIPRAGAEWLDQTEERMSLRHCGYWVSLAGEPETQQSKVSVSIPRIQVFDVTALNDLMAKVAKKMQL